MLRAPPPQGGLRRGVREAWERNEGFLGGSLVKNLPAMQETRVRSLGQEDPLEEGMA